MLTTSIENLKWSQYFDSIFTSYILQHYLENNKICSFFVSHINILLSLVDSTRTALNINVYFNTKTYKKKLLTTK